MAADGGLQIGAEAATIGALASIIGAAGAWTMGAAGAIGAAGVVYIGATGAAAIMAGLLMVTAAGSLGSTPGSFVLIAARKPASSAM